MKDTASLFITDSLDSLNPKKDTSILMMEEISNQEGKVFQCEMKDLRYFEQIVQADIVEIKDPISTPRVFTPIDQSLPLKDFNYVFMRKDPPVDDDFMNALHLLSQAELEGANVINRPAALQKFNEKILALRFSAWMPDTKVICKEADLKNFKDRHSTIILKPLNGMGGDLIYKFEELTSKNFEIFKSLTNNFQTMVMVQNFLPEIYEGDYRILIIHGEPFPIALARFPQGDSFKANLAAGGKGQSREINSVQRKVGKEVGKLLMQEGVVFAGIDMIGDYLTEINITSPTGAMEILVQSKQNPIQQLLQYL